MDIRFTVRLFFPPYRSARILWWGLGIQVACAALYATAIMRDWGDGVTGFSFIIAFALSFGTVDLYFLALREANERET